MAATDNKTVQQVWERSPNPYIGDSQEFYCGIEYEIEGIYAYHGSSTYAQMVEDSSLRNNGREFITVPGTLLNQLDWFDKIHSKIEYIIGDKPDTTAYPPHSERTSTHVHVNVLNLTMTKLAQFVRLYILFEPYFFSKVEPSRKDNIYCVPLYYTALPEIYHTSITYQVPKWHKYTAFNLLPIAKQGTIEFRHLQGTNEKSEVEGWLRTLKQLYDYNLENNIDFNLVLNDLDGVAKVFKGMFQQENVSMELFKDTVLDVKLSLAKNSVSSLNSRIQKLMALRDKKAFQQAELKKLSGAY
jgi:hypothetical protein